MKSFCRVSQDVSRKTIAVVTCTPKVSDDKGTLMKLGLCASTVKVVEMGSVRIEDGRYGNERRDCSRRRKGWEIVEPMWVPSQSRLECRDMGKSSDVVDVWSRDQSMKGTICGFADVYFPMRIGRAGKGTGCCRECVWPRRGRGIGSGSAIEREMSCTPSILELGTTGLD